MKKILISLFIIFCTTNLYAQSGWVDSLKLLLSKEKTDTGKIQLLIKMGKGFGMAKNDSALWYLQQALGLSEKINYTKGESQSGEAIGWRFFQLGNYPEALKISSQNIAKAERHKDTIALFGSLNLLTFLYPQIGDPKKALSYGKRAIELLNSPTYKDSIDMFKRAYTGMGYCYTWLKKPDSVSRYLFLSYEKSLKNKNENEISTAAINIALFYSREGKDSLAFSFFKKSIFYAKKSGDVFTVSEAQFGISKLFHKEGQSDSALYYAQQGLKNIDTSREFGIDPQNYSLLSELYQQRHQYDSAYKYLNKFITLRDKRQNQNKIIEAQNLSFNETLRQQQLEQAKKEAQQEYATKIKLYILASVILIFLIIAFFLVRNIRNKRKANLLLNKQKEEIEEQKKNVETTLSELKSTQALLIQSEKMASLGELTAGIAHEIQNPLNFVNNFSDVNKELLTEMKEEIDNGNIGEVKSIANDVIENSEKINHHGKRADAIVKGMLQHSRSSSGVKEPSDINALCDEYLRLSYHGLRAKDKSFNAAMKTDFDQSIGKINIVAQDIGRVILNLINNAFYAVNERLRQAQPDIHYEPTVSVTTKKTENHVLITVTDNGNGIPEKIKDKIFQPFFTTKPTGSGTGLGLSLAYDIVKAHGGEIKVESKEGKFTEFIIQLPA